MGLLFPGGILGLVLGAYPARGGYARNRAHGEEGGRAAMEAERPREWRRERASEGERLREPPVARLLTPASADLCESPAGPPRPSDPGLASTRASESGQHARPPALAAAKLLLPPPSGSWDSPGGFSVGGRGGSRVPVAAAVWPPARPAAPVRVGARH